MNGEPDRPGLPPPRAATGPAAPPPASPPAAPPPPAAPASPGDRAADVQAELSRTVAQIIPGAVERAPDPTTAVGLHWRIFDVTANWLILVLAVINLSLVFFDYTYVDLRHVYQQNGWTQLVAGYDKVKGIEPHRDTNNYAKQAEATFDLLEHDPASPDAQAALADMQALSVAIVKTDPWLTAGLRGVSEQFKAKFRRHEWLHSATFEQKRAWEHWWSPERLRMVFTLGGRPWDTLSVNKAMIGSAAAARLKGEPNTDMPQVQGFWTAENLQAARLHDERLWFESEVAPLLNRNYWQTYGENGEPNDRFWIIDCFFLPIFLIEFIVRGVLGVKRGVYANFGEFFATRWYDAVYFLPVITYGLPPTLQGPIHLVRVVSVGARMERLGLINPVAVVQARVAKVLDMITDIVNVKLLSNYQAGVRSFDLEASMNTLTPAQRAQLSTLIERNLSMVVGKVLPDVIDELERLISRTAAASLESAPAYKQLRALPLFGQLPEQLIHRVVTETIAQMQVTMLKAVNDQENVRLTKELIQAVTESLLRHMAEVGTEEQVKAMVVDVLEEQKRRIVSD